MSIRTEVLTAAEEAVSTFRQSAYGGPEQSFNRIAELWNGYLADVDGRPLQPHDVAALMILLKLARLQQDPSHYDSWVDIAGYAACGAETTHVEKPKLKHTTYYPFAPIDHDPYQDHIRPQEEMP